MPLSLKRADWLLSLEVGEHVSHHHEHMVIRNIHAHNHCGVILSWAPLDRYGIQHINNHDPSYIRSLFDELGYDVDKDMTKLIRSRARPWIQDHLFVFRRTPNLREDNARGLPKSEEPTSQCPNTMRPWTRLHRSFEQGRFSSRAGRRPMTGDLGCCAIVLPTTLSGDTSSCRLCHQ